MFDTIRSDSVIIDTGVPHGSILGPLFFSIYINDLPLATDVFNTIMYADDTTLCCTLEDSSSNNYIKKYK